MADSTSSKRLCVCVVVILALQFAGAKRFDRNAFQDILSGRFAPPSLDVLPDDNLLAQLQKKYAQKQADYITRLKGLLGTVESEEGDEDEGRRAGRSEGGGEGGDSCSKCKSANSNALECYANCITDSQGAFQELGTLIAAAVNNLICKPIGFRFLEEYFKNNSHSIWTDFKKFYDDFSSAKDSFSQETLTEIWMGNLLLLEKSPMVYYTMLEAQLRKTLLEDVVDLDSKTPAAFAADCDHNFAQAIAPIIRTLVSHSKNQEYLMDIVLRGLFTLRSAFFYTLGNYQNAAGAIIEALEPFVNHKCETLAFGLDHSVSFTEEDEKECDHIGRYPIPGFPIPSIFKDLGPECNPEPTYKPDVVEETASGNPPPTEETEKNP